MGFLHFRLRFVRGFMFSPSPRDISTIFNWFLFFLESIPMASSPRPPLKTVGNAILSIFWHLILFHYQFSQKAQLLCPLFVFSRAHYGKINQFVWFLCFLRAHKWKRQCRSCSFSLFSCNFPLGTKLWLHFERATRRISFIGKMLHYFACCLTLY